MEFVKIIKDKLKNIVVSVFSSLGLSSTNDISWEVLEFSNFSISDIIDWSKKNLKSKNDKVLITDTKDIFKEKLNTTDKEGLSNLESIVKENPIMMAHYNEATDTIDNIICVKADSIDNQVWKILNDSNGMLVIES